MFGRQIGDDLMQEKGHFVEQPLGRFGPLDDDRAGIATQLLLVIGRQVLTGVDDDRREGVGPFAAQGLQQGEARSVRQRQIQNHTVKGLGLELLQTFCGRADTHSLHVAGRQKMADGIALDQIVFDNQDASHRARQLFFQRREDLHQIFVLHRFDQIADGTQRQGCLAVVFAGNHVDRNVAGVVIALQHIQHCQSGLVGQADIQHHGIGLIALGHAYGFFRRAGHQHLEAKFARDIAYNGGETCVVFDHQKDASFGRQMIAVIVDGARGGGGQRLRRVLCFCAGGRDRRGGGQAVAHRLGCKLARGHLFGLIGARDDQREGAALARSAFHRQAATQKTGQFARDRQAQPRAAVFTADGAVSLTESLEDGGLMFGRNADACVRNGKGNFVHADRLDGQFDLACLGKFKGVGEQVFDDLFQTLAIGFQIDVCDRGDVDGEAQLAFVGHGLEQLSQIACHTLDGYRFGARLNMARLDLGQVEDVVDEVQKVIARGLDGAGVVHLLIAQIAVIVVGQKFRQDQQRVQRRAQFVRHIGQEVGLVLAGLFQLACLQGQIGTAALQIVALGFQHLGLFFQLAVGLFQFGLLLFQADL